jgi:hypothetical protein
MARFITTLTMKDSAEMCGDNAQTEIARPLGLVLKSPEKRIQEDTRRIATLIGSDDFKLSF